MEKFKNVFVVSQESSVAELTSGAKTLGENVTLFYTGVKEAAVNADKAYHICCEDDSFISYIPAIIDAVVSAKPELILVDCSKNGKLAAACISASCGTAVQSDVSEVSIIGNAVQTKRMAYGGSAIQTEVSTGVSILCVSTGTFNAAEPYTAAADIETLASKADARISFVGRKEKAEVKVNLASAKTVVGIGRGLAEESDLVLCRDFAEQLGAELACSRPVSEEKKWLPTACYVGVSGAMIKPDVYFSIGISGQVQHTVGVTGARTIIAVNKNESAPIFKCCDYGIVGDLRKIVPALNKLISK